MRTTVTLSYRAGVAVRALAAIFGGYALTAIAMALLARSVPASRVEAVMTATLLSFLCYACIVMWVFAVRSAARACIGLAGATAVLGAALWYMARPA